LEKEGKGVESRSGAMTAIGVGEEKKEGEKRTLGEVHCCRNINTPSCMSKTAEKKRGK